MPYFRLTVHEVVRAVVRRVTTASAIMGLAATLACTPAKEHSDFVGVKLPKPYEKPNVTLTDTQGRQFNFRDVTAGKVALVEFGYTHCPDICPVTMANIAAARAKLPYDVAQQVLVYFVTQDPERDTPQRLRSWLNAFDPSFVGVTGSAAAVDSLAHALDIANAAPARTGPTDSTYEVGHSAQVIAFTPDNQAHVIYPFGVRQEDWTSDLPKLVAVRHWAP